MTLKCIWNCFKAEKSDDMDRPEAKDLNEADGIEATIQKRGRGNPGIHDGGEAVLSATAANDDDDFDIPSVGDSTDGDVDLPGEGHIEEIPVAPNENPGQAI